MQLEISFLSLFYSWLSLYITICSLNSLTCSFLPNQMCCNSDMCTLLVSLRLTCCLTDPLLVSWLPLVAKFQPFVLFDQQNPESEFFWNPYFKSCCLSYFLCHVSILLPRLLYFLNFLIESFPELYQWFPNHSAHILTSYTSLNSYTISYIFSNTFIVMLCTLVKLLSTTLEVYTPFDFIFCFCLFHSLELSSFMFK